MPNFFFIHKDAELTLTNVETVTATNKTEAKTVFNKTLLKYKSKNTIKDFRILNSEDYDKLYAENENIEVEKYLSKLKLHDTCKLILRKLIEDEYIYNYTSVGKREIKRLGLDKYNGQDFYVYYNNYNYFGNFASNSDIVKILENLINDGDDSCTILVYLAKTGEQVQLNITISDIKFTVSDSSYINLNFKE
jgi:hypothetical protein